MPEVFKNDLPGHLQASWFIQSHMKHSGGHAFFRCAFMKQTSIEMERLSKIKTSRAGLK
jgi:hypothetical protein